MVMTVLKDELEYYNAKLTEWLDHYEGQFALVKDRQLIGTFTTELEAYEEGVRCFGNVSFLIKKVERVEKIENLPALTLGLIRANL